MKSRFKLGTAIENITRTMNVPSCGGCKERKLLLDQGKYGQAMLTFIGINRKEPEDVLHIQRPAD